MSNFRLAKSRAGETIHVIRPNTTETVAVTAAAAQTPVADPTAASVVLRLVSTVACHYKINAAATTSDHYLPANLIEHIWCEPGDYLSFIRSTADGTAYVSEAG